MAEPDPVGQQSSDTENPPGSVVDIVLGCTAMAAGTVQRAGLPVLRASRSVVQLIRRATPPSQDEAAARWLAAVSREGHRRRTELQDRLGTVLESLADSLVPVLVRSVLDRVDLTTIVRERIDLDTLVALVDVDAVVATVDLEAALWRVDVDGIAARIDLDAVLDRIDLTRLVRERVDLDAVLGTVDLDAVVDRVDLVRRTQMIIDAIDLPELIRESTGSVASETVRGVRLRSVAADDVVRRAADRLLPHRGSRRGQGVDAILPGTPPDPVDRPDGSLST